MQDQIQRMLTYDRIEEAARCANLVQVQWQCQNYKRNLEKAICKASAPHAKERAILQRGLLQRQKERADKIRKERDTARFRRSLQAKIRAKKVAKKVETRLAGELRKSRLAALADIPHEFDAQNCEKGGYGKSGLQMRTLCLSRLHLCCPELPPELEGRWPDVLNWCAGSFSP